MTTWQGVIRTVEDERAQKGPGRDGGLACLDRALLLAEDQTAA